jgi:hypothetical protein
MNPLCVEVETTATFLGDVEICISYDDTGMTYSEEIELRMVTCEEIEQGNTIVLSCVPVDPCDPFADPPYHPAVDTVKNIVCACTDHFSMFAVGTLLDSDGDTVSDLLDNCPYVVNWFQEDMDKDDIGDACDNCPEAYDPTNNCFMCTGDFDEDGDVDGSDLFDVAANPDSVDLSSFAASFGRSDCPVPVSN